MIDGAVVAVAAALGSVAATRSVFSGSQAITLNTATTTVRAVTNFMPDPLTVFFDSRGKAVRRWEGVITAAQLESVIAELP